MQAARHRRLVASATALLVALSGCLALLSAAPASAIPAVRQAPAAGAASSPARAPAAAPAAASAERSTPRTKRAERKRAEQRPARPRAERQRAQKKPAQKKTAQKKRAGTRRTAAQQRSARAREAARETATRRAERRQRAVAWRAAWKKMSPKEKRAAKKRAAARRRAEARRVAAAERADRLRRAVAWRAAWKAMSPREKRAARKRIEARHRAEARAAAAARRAAARQAAAAAEAAAERRARARYMARWAKVRPLHPKTWLTWAPGHVTPRSGPVFNNPYGGPDQRRRLLNHVIDAIDASPGYRLRRPGGTGRQLTCPTDPAQAPSEIKIAVYSIADKGFADAIIAAHRRCVSVQVLMNSHLTSVTSLSWGRIIDELGARGTHWRQRRSFAHRCSSGCLGTSTLHSKFYLFSHAGAVRNTVIVGSSNMTRNAVGVQWNDLFTVNGHPTMYQQYRSMFERMTPDDETADGPFVFPATGHYQSTFYPFRAADRNTDKTVQALRSVRCRGAEDGTGIRGRTVVYVAMHAWFGDRGRAITAQLRGLYRRGCYVRILYSFVMRKTYRLLTAGTGRRMVMRRMSFADPYGVTATKYSHLKMYAISGHIGEDHSSDVVYTGSSNWTDRANHGDEVTLRIESAAAYRAYVGHWTFMATHRSSPLWAFYEEPVGGGRAP